MSWKLPAAGIAGSFLASAAEKPATCETKLSAVDEEAGYRCKLDGYRYSIPS